ncbi:MAG: PAS domain S-box protein [Chloroflexaceae bacterium]|nr:PAS domain S-box protein [Chloroflexaceae bacterium]
MEMTIEQLRAENEALRQRLANQENENLAFAHLFEHAADAHFIIDEGRFIACNDAFVKMLGATSKEQILSLPPDAISPEYQPDGQLSSEKARDYITRALDHGHSRIEWVHSRLTDGENFLIEVSLHAATYQGKRVVYGNWHDITERKQVEEQVAQSQSMLRTIFDNVPVMISIRDLQGKFTFVNKNYAASLGTTPDQVVGRYDYDFFPPEVMASIKAFDEQMIDHGGLVQQEEIMPLADGLHHTFLSNRFPIFNEQGTISAIGGVSVDITERKQMESAMRLTQFTIDCLSDAIFWLRPDGSLHSVNDAACQSLGYTRAELLSMNLGDIDPLQTPDVWRDTWNAVKSQGAIVLESQHRRQDGSILPIEVQANFLDYHGQEFICAIARNITERKEQAEALLMSKFALERANDGVEWFDSEGRLILVNDMICRHLGYSRDELLTMSIPDIDPNITREIWAEQWNQFRQTGSFIAEALHRRRDGTVFPIEVSATYLELQGKELAISFVRDITDRRQVEAERAALQQQVIDAQRHALRELSTPFIPITDEIVIMPLIGTIDSQRAQQLMEVLLEGVAQYQAELVILDITGVQMVDTQVAQALMQAAQAVRLLGAQVMMTGIQPQLAQTLVHLGVDLSSMQTRSSLQSGIAAALKHR